LDSTSNWETAAAIAAVCIGLGGLLLFSAVAMAGAWRVASAAERASREAEKASAAVQSLHEACSTPEVRPAHGQGLMIGFPGADPQREQQGRLNEAGRLVMEAGVLRDGSPAQAARIEATVRRLDETITRLSAALERLRSTGS
jgi:hypothetical protein